MGDIIDLKKYRESKAAPKDVSSIFRQDDHPVFKWPDFTRIAEENAKKKERQAKERNEANKKVLTNYKIKG